MCCTEFVSGGDGHDYNGFLFLKEELYWSSMFLEPGKIMYLIRLSFFKILSINILPRGWLTYDYLLS